MRRGSIILLLASLFVAVFFIGCENDTEPNDLTKRPDIDKESSEYENQQITIGLSMDTLIEERWKKDRDMFKEAVEALGAKVVIKAANGDDALQIAQAETMISEGVDLLVLVPHNAEAAATIVGRAQLAEVPVISYDRLVKNANIDLYISFDNEQIGVLQAEAMIDAVPKGNYAYIGGANTDHNAHLIKEGVFRILQPLIDQGDIVVVYDQWTKGWMPKHAKENMRAALAANNNEIDAVIAANDATAGGVIEALSEVGLNGQIPVAGQDAELLGVQRVLSDEQLMTVYKSIRSLTDQAADIAVRMAKGEEIETEITINNGKKDVPTVFLTPVIVDAQNIQATVIEDGFHTYEDIFE